MRRFIIVIIGIVLLMPLGVSAKANVTLSCDKSEALKSDTIRCVVGISTNEKVSAIYADIILTDNIKFENDTNQAEGWQGDSRDGTIALYNLDDVEGNLELTTLIFKIGEKEETTERITLDNVIFTNEKLQDLESESVSHSISVLRADKTPSDDPETPPTPPTEEEKNPSTSDAKIIIVLACAFGLVLVALVAKKRLNKVK